MKIENTAIKGCFIIKPTVLRDERGYFFESFNQQKFEETIGTAINFVQDNESFSTQGVLRGLHFQKEPHAQAKLVRVIEGEVLDIAIDLRKDSNSYGKMVSVLLSSKNKKQLFIPRGCAHGFVTISEKAIFAYKCDNFYNKESESGIRYDDPILNIDWILPEEELIISEKDKLLTPFNKIIHSV